jgi:Mrp family chromosome partitioning ATPase
VHGAPLHDPAELFRSGGRLADSFVELRTKVELELLRAGRLDVCLVARSSGEGTSTVASNLVWALAMVGQQVVLVEADLRRPSLSQGFVAGFPNATRNDGRGIRVPVAGALGETPLVVVAAEEMAELAGTQAASGAGFHPADVVSARLPELLRDPPAPANLTVVDAPPIGAPETKLIVALTDRVIVVVDASRRDTLQAFGDTVRQIEDAGGELLGVVLNCAGRG